MRRFGWLCFSLPVDLKTNEERNVPLLALSWLTLPLAPPMTLGAMATFLYPFVWRSARLDAIHQLRKRFRLCHSGELSFSIS